MLPVTPSLKRKKECLVRLARCLHVRHEVSSSSVAVGPCGLAVVRLDSLQNQMDRQTRTDPPSISQPSSRSRSTTPNPLNHRQRRILVKPLARTFVRLSQTLLDFLVRDSRDLLSSTISTLRPHHPHTVHSDRWMIRTDLNALRIWASAAACPTCAFCPPVTTWRAFAHRRAARARR